MITRLRPWSLQRVSRTTLKAPAACQVTFNPSLSFQRPKAEDMNTACSPAAVDSPPRSIYDFHLGVDGELTIYDLHMGVDRELLSLVGDTAPSSPPNSAAGERKSGTTSQSNAVTLLEQMRYLLDLRDQVDAQIEGIGKRIRELQLEEKVKGHG